MGINYIKGMRGFIKFPMVIGTYTASLAGQVDGSGVSLAQNYAAAASNRMNVLEVNADTGSKDLTGDTYCSAIKGRLCIGTTQTNASLMGILGTLDVGTVNISANYFALRGHLDFWGSCTISGTSFVGAVSAYVENEATTTVGASQHLDGVDIYQVGAPSVNATGFNSAINVRSSASAAAWKATITVGGGMHCSINTTDSDKTIRLNSRTYTVAASIVGMQTKPRAGVNMTNDCIGIESMPGIGVTAITSSAGIVCFKAEPYIHATAGAITGDVRGYEVSLGCPSGAGTITGALSGLKCVNNTAKAVTGGIYPIYAVTPGDAQAWTAFALVPAGGGLTGTTTPSSAYGYLAIAVGTPASYSVKYIQLLGSATGG